MRRMSPLLAASVVILSACGGGAGPTDATDDADTAIAADTIGNDTVTPDVSGRDVDDVATLDVADDAVDVDANIDANVGQDVTVGPDVTGDAGLDVPGDAVPGDVGVDALCVPDCTGGPCTDDGCGGDCCDAPNVCDRNFDGSTTVCLPLEGTTCAQIGECSSPCTDAACNSACYNAGSADARDAIWAAGDCVMAVCPEITQGCVTGAYGEGGACHAEYSNCMNSCTPDCSGGPCTDDGCNGDCCAAPNVCQAPESGVGLECVAVVKKTCQEIWTCATDCADQECAQECINSGSTDGQAQLTALLTCLNNACPGGATEECVNAAVQSGAECFDEYTTCFPT